MWNQRTNTPSQTRARHLYLLALAFAVMAALPAPAIGQQQLVWSDEFSGSSLDTSKWEYQIGTGCPSLCGWGNNELQYYRSQNVAVSGGTLRITAQAQSFSGSAYTSGRIRTRGDMGIDWTYGRFEARAKLPRGQGLWPAIWMLPTDYVYGGWAASGEIDIMELVGHEPNRVHGTLHYGDTWPGNVFSGSSYTLPTGDFSDAFHTFALEWEPTQMRWYVDGILYATQSAWWSNAGTYPAPFDQPFHLLLNVAVGGNWPGNPNGSTQFPQMMEVDYVRVYQDTGAPQCSLEFDDMEHADPFANDWLTFNGPNGGGSIFGVAGDVPPFEGEATSLGVSFGSGGLPGYQGGFGRTKPMNLEDATHFELWISADPGVEGTLSINLQDDDNGDGSIPNPPLGHDDEFQTVLSVGGPGSAVEAGAGWQHLVVPLTDFVDDNSYLFGGNGFLDAVPTSSGGNGQLINVVVALDSANGADTTFRTDAWRFTRRTGSISGSVWNDVNEDGQFFFEQGLAGIQLELVDVSRGTLLSTTVTNMVGAYTLTGATEGLMQVRLVPGALPVGTTATNDPDGAGTFGQANFLLACDESLFFQDFGFSLPAPSGSLSFCFGDGGDQLGCTDCPCANNAPPGTIGGCLNSSGNSGSLIDSGVPSASNDTLRFEATGLPASAFSILTSGDGIAPANAANPCFGLNSGTQAMQFDGLRCAVMNTSRHGGRPADANGDVGLTNNGWGTPSGPPTGLIAQGGFAAGQTRNYQLIYREDATLGCMRGLNTSQAVAVTFQP